MGCGTGDFACVVATWFSEHSEIATNFFKLVFSAIGGATAQGGPIAALIQQHAEKIFAACSLAFGIWKWWKYREGILHKRLVEYIDVNDRRLGPTSAAAVETILRPVRTSVIREPAFSLEIERILARNSWGRTVTTSLFGVMRLENKAQWKLGGELRKLRRRHSVARNAVRSLVEQQAQLHMISGAIFVSRARRSRRARRTQHYDFIALREFRKVQQFPGHQRDTTSKENEAIQLLRLGRNAEALKAFDELREFSNAVADTRARDLIIARSMRYRAQITQIMSLPFGSTTARGLLLPPIGQPDADCALTRRAPHQPFRGWDAIEQAEIHFIAAWVALENGNANHLATQRAASEATYQSIINDLPRFRILMNAGQKLLWREARNGLKRLEQSQSGHFDLDWIGTTRASLGQKSLSTQPPA